jgi:anhydro-N-acetylmuramic acid kinase
MNHNIRRLAKIASKKSRMIIGLMSGTSMDGLDVALCRISNHGTDTRFKILAFETVSYQKEVKERIFEVFARKHVDFEKLCMLHPWLGTLHGRMVLQCLKKWKVAPNAIDVIASHGQTVLHSPASLHPDERINSTLQIADSDHLSVVAGIITVGDFRQKHIATGGEGAPLAVYGDYLLLAHKTENRILLNIGGIANFTYLPAGRDPGKVFVTDTGPGNTLLDQVIRLHFPGEYFDKDSKRALEGVVHRDLLGELKSHAFFKMSFPKTTGPELFNVDYVHRAQKQAGAENISVEDLLATLTRFSADTIVAAIRKAVKKNDFKIYLSGGGAHNPLLSGSIGEMLNMGRLPTTAELGVPVDAKEALLFAVLANETLAGGKVNFGRRAKIPDVSMGKISFPQ